MSDPLRIEHLLSVKKLDEEIEINFAFSNMEFLLKEEELPFSKESIRLTAPAGEVRLTCRRLVEVLSQREKIPEENIFLSAGSSMANFILMSIFVKQGDRVLIEHPVYEPLLKILHYLQADIHYLKRDPNDFALLPEEIEKNFTKNTRLIVLTDSHNPSGNQLSPETLNLLKKIHQEYRTEILIDEVFSRYYRDQSLFSDYPQFILTGSLSKYYGLGSLRAGWAFARKEVVERAKDFIDFITPELPYCSFYLAAELMSADIFIELERRIKERVEQNREIVIDFLNHCNYLTTYIPRAGLLFFPQIRKGIDSKKFHKILREKYKMVVTPGAFFGLPRFFRFAAIYNAETVREGLKRIDSALHKAAES